MSEGSVAAVRERWRWAVGVAAVLVAGVLKLAGPHGAVFARLGPLPDLTASDLFSIPVAAAGLTLVSSVASGSRARRAAGAAAIVVGVLWVTGDLPWDDPLIPGAELGGHGLHALDALAGLPIAFGVSTLAPGRGRKPRSESSDSSPPPLVGRRSAVTQESR